MAFLAIHSFRAASLFKRFNVLIFLPEGAFLILIVVLARISAIILNVMGINTLRSIVISGDGAPYGLIGIEVKF